VQNCNKESDWFGLITTFNEVIPLAWHLLEDDDRGEFLKLRDQASDVLYGMASPHALRILTELLNQSLHVFGGMESVNPVDKSEKFRVAWHENGQIASKDFDYIIDCTGFGKHLTHSGILLIDNLLKQGFLRPHRFGGAVVNFQTGQIIGVEGVPRLHIYTLTGTLNIGTRVATNGLSAVASSARRTAEAVHALLFPDFDQSDSGEPNYTGLGGRIQEGLRRASQLGSHWRRTIAEKLGP